MRINLLIGFLIVLLVILGIGILFKFELLSTQIIVENKSFIEALKDIILIITVIGGGILSYYNFFKGRTFSLKADIHFDVKIFKTPDNNILHIIKVEVENKGNLTIWGPQIVLKISQYSKNGSVDTTVIKNWKENSEFLEQNKRTPLLDAGEKVYFIADKKLSPDIWLVTYKAELKAHNNKTWQNSINIENKINNSDEDSFKMHQAN